MQSHTLIFRVGHHPLEVEQALTQLTGQVGRLYLPCGSAPLSSEFYCLLLFLLLHLLFLSLFLFWGVGGGWGCLEQIFLSGT